MEQTPDTVTLTPDSEARPRRLEIQAQARGDKPHPIIRIFPSLTDAAFLMPVAFLLMRTGGASGFLEGDTGWHIRTGQWILQNGRAPDTDIFSFTKAGEPWYAWEWLWDVIFGWLHLQAGMGAVILASLLVLCVTFTLLFRLCRRQCPNVFLAFGVTWLAAAASTIHWLARPHLFSLLFAVIFYAILERVREGRTRLLWWLPFLTVIWTNLHGGFFIGILFLAAFAGGRFLEALLAPSPAVRCTALRCGVPYVFAGLGCLAASLVNPYFYHLHVHIAHYLTDDYHFRVIGEFQSLSFHNPAGRYFEAIMVLGLVAVAWHIARRRFEYALLLGGWLHLALVSARNIPLYGIAAVPVIGLALWEMLEEIRVAPVAGWVKSAVSSFHWTAADFGETDGIARLHLVSIAGALLVVALVLAPKPPSVLIPDYDAKTYPVAAVSVLPAAASTKVFTDDEWGDYLIYRLYPTGKVFIDGRSDFYGAEFGEKYIELMSAKFDWEATLNEYGITTVLLSAKAPLASVLKQSRRWQTTYDDHVAIVFQSTAPPHSGASTGSIASASGSFRDPLAVTPGRAAVPQIQPKPIRRKSL